ncbi:PilT/PilU family type 4a pilus ATPase [Clostridia bacterium OttesenSCG-928-F22]|nr:PilT/PilU family type 4a pilus ATPase [Clostridia bacterium OttesenSCG-928-F22]
MNLEAVLHKAIEEKASDIFIISHLAVTFKVEGNLMQASPDLLKPETTEELIREIYVMANNRSMDTLLNTGDDDFSFSVPGQGRFRANTFRQRGSLAAIIRIIMFDLPDPSALNIPDSVMNLAEISHGLVLVTGAAGSGKSTTLACIIDRINRSKHGHIITMEDPIEYIHRHRNCVVSQREIPSDTHSYVTALRAALRQSPNVLLLGEMRDSETIEIAMTAAETGQLVLSTLHTLGAANSIDRIIDSFPHNQQRQIRMQLSMVLKAVVSQQLLPCTNGTQRATFEVMISNLAIQNLIREEKIHQIDNAIFSGAKEGMMSMDNSVLELYKQGLITAENAIRYSTNYATMENQLKQIKI